MTIIADPDARAARAAEKRVLLLRFLRDEIYTTLQVAGMAMGVGERAARATIARLESAGLVRRWPVELADGLPPLVIVGITSRGQAEAFDPATERAIDRAFEPSRRNLAATLRHTLDMQRLRIEAMRAGAVRQWINADRLAAARAGAKKPDAVCLNAHGERIAIEVERSIKAPRRYVAVLEGHLTSIHQRKWSRVIWACPDPATATRVRALVLGISRARVAGIDTRIDPELHHAGLSFCTYSNFIKTL